MHDSERHGANDPRLAAFNQRFRPGAILGHEISGEIVELGSAVTDLDIGDRVACMALGGCGRCEACESGTPLWCPEKRSVMGGYAEYAVACQFTSVRLPRGMGPDAGALVEPLAAARHAVQNAELPPEARVLVIGDGAMGLGVVACARDAGVGRIATVSRSGHRESLAGTLGADATLRQGPDLAAAAADALGGPADVVFECAGKVGLVDQAMTCVRPRGTVVIVGMCFDRDPLVHAYGGLRELRLQYAMAYSLDDFDHAIQMLSQDESLASMVTSTVSFDEFPAIFDELRSGSPQCKVQLTPWSGGPTA